MIPLQLRGENFMSYGELALDLSGVHLAVLTGPNGAGKSSLLDALTFALWEKARAAPEQLIRLGQREMWVELTFSLEGRIYRVFRRRTRRAGVGSQLELHQREGDGWVSLTGATTRETQARLVGIVKMDHETFVHSAFLRQGRADAFTTKTPQERKAVLAEMLGLAAYDALAARARERWRAEAAAADSLQSEQASLRAELEARADVTAALAAARDGLHALAERVAAAEADCARLGAEGEGLRAAAERREALASERERADAHLERLRRERAAAADALEAVARAAPAGPDTVEADYAAWRAAAEAVAGLRAAAEAHDRLARAREDETRRFEQEARQLERAMQALEADEAAIAHEADAHAAVLRERGRIEQAQAVLAAAREAETRHLEQARAVRGLETELLALERAHQQALLAAEAARAALAARAASARADADAAGPLAEALAGCEARLQALDVAVAEQERAREKGIRHRARQAELQEAIARTLAAAEARSVRLAELAAEAADRVGCRAPGAEGERPSGPGPAPEPGGGHCPTCATRLDSGGLERVAARLRDEARGLEAEAEHLELELAEVERLIDSARARLAERAGARRDRDAALRLWGELRAALRRAEAAAAEADRLEAAAAAVPTPPAPPALDSARRALAAVGHDPAELAVVQARIQECRWAEARGWQLEQALVATQRLEARRAPLSARRAALAAGWETEQHAHQARVAELTAALAEHAGAAEALSAAQARLSALAGAPEAWAARQRQLVALAAAEARLAGLDAERTRADAARGALDAAEAALGAALERAGAWEAERAEAEGRLAALRGDERGRLEALGRLEAESARLAALAERLAEREAAWRVAAADAAAFKELAAAFGRNGIQAVLIENALPEIESDANRLLALMTDNRMHVRLATQREKKTGGVHETLEIAISDEVGTRPYELYSGGEAFRVNFALRLALSRLLARRSGAKLQTLIIDEGFGTQDERGRERLVAAINAVSGEFARILVVTHIRELKDAFNTHIEVAKRGGVSEVRAIA